jgi:hypothetical protein
MLRKTKRVPKGYPLNTRKACELFGSLACLAALLLLGWIRNRNRCDQTLSVRIARTLENLVAKTFFD